MVNKDWDLGDRGAGAIGSGKHKPCGMAASECQESSVEPRLHVKRFQAQGLMGVRLDCKAARGKQSGRLEGELHKSCETGAKICNLISGLHTRDSR
jgi:hypothetical protein